MRKAKIVPIKLLPQDHESTIVTVKSKRSAPPDEGFYLLSQTIASFQYLSHDGYYAEVCPQKQGNKIASIGLQPKIFDVAINPGKMSATNLKKAFLSVMQTKILEDVESYLDLLNKLREDGKISTSQLVSALVNTDDIAKKIKGWKLALIDG